VNNENLNEIHEEKRQGVSILPPLEPKEVRITVEQTATRPRFRFEWRGPHENDPVKSWPPSPFKQEVPGLRALVIAWLCVEYCRRASLEDLLRRTMLKGKETFRAWELQGVEARTWLGTLGNASQTGEDSQKKPVGVLRAEMAKDFKTFDWWRALNPRENTGISTFTCLREPPATAYVDPVPSFSFWHEQGDLFFDAKTPSELLTMARELEAGSGRWDPLLQKREPGDVQINWFEIVRNQTRTVCARFEVLGGKRMNETDFKNLLVSRRMEVHDRARLEEERARDSKVRSLMHDFGARSGPTPPQQSSEGRANGLFLSPEPILSVFNRLLPWQTTHWPASFVLLGRPGEGKTTASTYLAWLAAGAEHHPSAQLLPYFVRLKDFATWADENRPLQPVLEEYLSVKPAEIDGDWPPKYWWRDMLHVKGSLLLILDGLDELDPKSKVTEQLFSDLKKWQACNNRLLITCRELSFALYDQEFAIASVWKLEGWAVRSPEWYAYIEGYPKLESTGRNQLLTQLQDSSLEDLSRAPFLLDLLCYIYSGQPTNLETRSDIFDAGVMQLIHEQLYKVTNGRTSLDGMDACDIFEALCLVALDLQTENPGRNQFPYEAFSKAMTSAVGERSKAQRVCDFCIDARLVSLRKPTPTARPSANLGSFAHNSIHDFLAARGIFLKLERGSGSKVESEYFSAENVLNPLWFECLGYVPSQCTSGYSPRRVFEVLTLCPDDLLRHRSAIIVRGLLELRLEQRSTPWAENLALKSWELLKAYSQTDTWRLVTHFERETRKLPLAFPCLAQQLVEQLRHVQKSDRLLALDLVLGFAEWLNSDNSITVALEGSLGSGDWDEALVASEILSRFPKIVPTRLASLYKASREREDWYLAALILETCGSPQALKDSAASSLINGWVESALRRERHWRMRAAACRVFARGFHRNGEDVISQLLEYTKGENEEKEDHWSHGLRARACDALGRTDAPDGERIKVVERLVALLGDRIRAVSDSALASLLLWKDVHTALVFEILRRKRPNLSSGNGRIQQCRLLGYLTLHEEGFENTVDYLLASVLDSCADVQIAACEALGKLIPRVKQFPVVNQFSECLRSKNYGVQKACAEALARLASVQENADDISRLLITHATLPDQEASWSGRARCIDALASLSLPRAIQDELFPRLVEFARSGLDWTINPTDIRSLPGFANAVKKPSSVRPDFARLCGLLSKETRDLLEQYDSTECTLTKENEIRNGLSNDLNRLIEENRISWFSECDERTMPERAKWLSANPSEIRTRPWARRELVGFLCFREVLPQGSDGGLASAAICALGNLGQGRTETLPVLLDALYRPEWSVAIAGLRALDNGFLALLSYDSTSLRSINSCLSSPDAYVRAVASEAIGNFVAQSPNSPMQDEQLAGLLANLMDSDAVVRSSASRVIAKIGVKRTLNPDWIKYSPTTDEYEVCVGGHTFKRRKLGVTPPMILKLEMCSL
jgi:HEAT repeat protein